MFLMKVCFKPYFILQSLIFCYILLVLSSCSVQFEKRRYTHGYYVDVQLRTAEKETNRESEYYAYDMKSFDHDFQLASNPKILNPSKRTLNFESQNEPCDRIYFTDGTHAEVKVLDVNDKEVAYRKCNEPNSPVILLNKKHISKIEFSSGVRYEEGMEEAQEQHNKQDKVQKTDETTNQPQNQQQKPKQSQAKEGVMNIIALIFAVVGVTMLILTFVHAWFWLFGASIFSALGASLGWFGINKPLKGLGIVALIIGTVCSILSSVWFGFL